MSSSLTEQALTAAIERDDLAHVGRLLRAGADLGDGESFIPVASPEMAPLLTSPPWGASFAPTRN